MKKFFKFALVGAFAASLVPFVVDVDDSDENQKKTSVKSLLYSIDLTTTATGDEAHPEKTSVSVTIPGLLGDFIGKMKCRRAIPDEMVEEIADKIDRDCCEEPETEADTEAATDAE